MGGSESKPEPPQAALMPSAAGPALIPTDEDGKQCGPKVGKSGKKICCSCPDTKAIRDDCVLMNGEDKCADAIEAHKKCLRSEGFYIR